MLFVLPGAAGRAASAGRCSTQIGPRDGDGVDVPRRPRRTAPSRSATRLYASLGIVPRVPLLNLVGTAASRARASGRCRPASEAVSFEELAARCRPMGTDRGTLAWRTAVDDLDREPLGAAHPIDHRFLRTEGRRGWLYLGRPTATSLGYGYAGEAGRVGPVAVRDAELLAPVVGHLLGAVQPARRASRCGCPAARTARRGGPGRPGFRLEAFPVLLCWDRPFADSSRYCRSRRACSDRPAAIALVGRRAAGRRDGSLGLDVAPPAVPADGVEPNQDRWRQRPPPSPTAETPVTARPCSHAGPLPSQPPDRPRPGATRPARDRAVLVLHDVTKQLSRTARWPCATWTSSSPRATSCSSSGRRAPGKSTLIKLLIRDEVATRGEVVLDGQDLARLRAGAGPADAPQDRDHLPGLQAAADEDGLGERGVRARGHRARRAARSGPRSIACSRSSG